MSLHEFVAWVNAYVTPAMASLGFDVCSTGEGIADDDPATWALVSDTRARFSVRHRPHKIRRRGRRRRFFSVGYEGDSGHELWMHYWPASGTLDLSDWDFTLGQDVGWGGREYRCTVEPTELEERLHASGRAISHHGLHPSFFDKLEWD